jgi:hypothetical protein
MKPTLSVVPLNRSPRAATVDVRHMQSCDIHGVEGCACLDAHALRDPLEDAKRRSLGRIVVAIICTLVTLAIVGVTR